MRSFAVFMLMSLFALPVAAEIQTKAVHYEHDGEKLTGHLYWDDAQRGERPGVLVVHEWWGLNEYAKKRARMLTELGYVAFAADMYGGGKVTETPDQAREWMQEVTADVEGWRERAAEGLKQLVAGGRVDEDRLAAIGYCFGGATVLQMAYGNAPVRGVVSFHGALPSAPEEVKGKIDPQILVLHGNADSFIAPEVVTHFRKKLEASEAVWEMNSYGGVKHGFTNPDADRSGIPNLAYDGRADRRSWKGMQDFFAEIF